MTFNHELPNALTVIEPSVPDFATLLLYLACAYLAYAVAHTLIELLHGAVQTWRHRVEYFARILAILAIYAIAAIHGLEYLSHIANAA